MADAGGPKIPRLEGHVGSNPIWPISMALGPQNPHARIQIPLLRKRRLFVAVITCASITTASGEAIQEVQADERVL